MENSSEDLLNDIVEPQLVQAGSGKRFANFMIDRIIFMVIAYIITFAILYSNPEGFSSTENAGFSIAETLITWFFYACYMSFIEIITKGRSIGKFFTGTKVVNEDGSNISAGTAFERGFSRIVPFEAFSALGNPCYPWHDKWSKTFVIDIKNSSMVSRSTENSHQNPEQ
jgi:uncharacterized RDD family membrane protein YckC